MIRQTVAIIVCAALLTSACASTGGARYAQAGAPRIADTSVMTDYVQRIPAGSRVRVETTMGQTRRGTLLKADAQVVTVQLDTRIPEAPIEIPLNTIARLSLDDRRGTSTAKAVGIGVAAGVGAFFGIMAIIFATFDD